MDFADVFLTMVTIGVILFFVPAIISGFQTRKENKLVALEKQTEEENAKIMLEINNILDVSNDPRAHEQLLVNICCSCGFVNVTDKTFCTKCNNSLAI